jgi:hypothetical protein
MMVVRASFDIILSPALSPQPRPAFATGDPVSIVIFLDSQARPSFETTARALTIFLKPGVAERG